MLSRTPVLIAVHEDDVRTVDGAGNNEANPAWGAAGSALRLDVSQAYDDGISSPSGASRPSARVVSNAVCAQAGDLPNDRGLSDLFWVFGQFVDHDIDLTTEGDEAFDIEVPLGDPIFDPFETGVATIGLRRSNPLSGSGTDVTNPRRHANEITSWIDASHVYGSDAERANALRALDGSGRLRVREGALLPLNTTALANAPTAEDPRYVLAGDVRANENVALTALHTLFVREHNRVADRLSERNPHLSGDQVYAAARSWVTAELQVITYREFLPHLLGRGGIAPYRGYDATVDGSIGVLFSTAAYRFGHSMVSGELLRLDADGEEAANGHLSLIEAFFNPTLLIEGGDVDPILRGLAGKRAQALDPLVVDDLRNFLFGAPGSPGLDLAALNMQRGRDHGLPDYNTCRVDVGLQPVLSIAEVSSNADFTSRLTAAYDDVDDMDVWVCALCEDPVDGAVVGELLFNVFKHQFERLRDGDRFWYERIYAAEALRELEATRLSDLIRRNSGVDGEISADPFVVGEARHPSRGGPSRETRTRGEVGAMLQNRFTR